MRWIEYWNTMLRNTSKPFRSSVVRIFYFFNVKSKVSCGPYDRSIPLQNRHSLPPKRRDIRRLSTTVVSFTFTFIQDYKIFWKTWRHHADDYVLFRRCKIVADCWLSCWIRLKRVVRNVHVIIQEWLLQKTSPKLLAGISCRHTQWRIQSSKKLKSVDKIISSFSLGFYWNCRWKYENKPPLTIRSASPEMLRMLDLPHDTLHSGFFVCIDMTD